MLCDPGIRASREVVIQSLEPDFDRRFIFILQEMITQCERETAWLVVQVPAKVDVLKKPLPPARSRMKQRVSLPPPIPAAHDHSAIGQFYRKMRARLGPEKASRLPYGHHRTTIR
jgi:hypothetical protein